MTVPNRINVRFTREQAQEVLDLVNQIRQKMTFLVGLSNDERRRLVKLPAGARAMLMQSYQFAQQNDQLMPRHFDLEAMAWDMESNENLNLVLTALNQVLRLVEDGELITGSEAYNAARLVYDSSKRSGNDAEHGAAIRDMGSFFANRARREAAETGSN
jgi:hypothetical protein